MTLLRATIPGNLKSAMQAEVRKVSGALRRAVGTMKQASTSTGAALRFGGGFAGAFGNEYGAHQNIPRQGARGTYLGYNQFPSWKGSGETAGYAMWPGIRKAADEGVEALADAVTKILEG